MSQVRRRTAIGIFATPDELNAAAARLRGQGISNCLACPLAQAVTDITRGSDGPALRAATLGDLRTRFPGAMLLRVDLNGASEEAIVARTLLESAAQSVQLHDF